MYDFFIGLTLMNAMPHYVLGVWRAKMLSGFGLGHTRNIIWALLNFIASVSLFVYRYGWQGFAQNTLFSGALLVLVTFFFTSPLWYRFFYTTQKGGGQGGKDE